MRKPRAVYDRPRGRPPAATRPLHRPLRSRATDDTDRTREDGRASGGPINPPAKSVSAPREVTGTPPVAGTRMQIARPIAYERATKTASLTAAPEAYRAR